MRAIILAAGQGSRLRPLTTNLPKTMIKLFGKTLLQNQILTLREMGVGEITVISGFCSDLIEGDDINIVKNNNFETTNMVSSLFCASHMFNDKSDIIIAYGDIIYEKRILEELFNCNSSISLTADLDWEKLWKVRLDDPLSDAETFKIDSLGFIKELGKKPKSYRDVEAQYMGLIKINSGYQRSLLKDSDIKAKKHLKFKAELKL